MKWYERIYTPQWQKKFERFARSKFSSFDDLDDIIEESRQALYLKMADMGDSEPSDAYIMTVFKHEIVSRNRSKYGYPRPGKWLSDHDPLGSELFDLHCMQHKSRPEVLETLEKQVDEVPEHSPPKSQYLAIAKNLLLQMADKRECSKVRDANLSTETPLGNEEGGGRLGDVLPADGQSDPLEALMAQETHSLAQVLMGLDGEDGDLASGEPLDALYGQLSEMAQNAEDVPLDDEDRLIFRTCYYAKASERQAAEDLGTSPSKLRRKRQGAQARLHEWLKQKGFTLD